jgi:hypothetical protein
MPVGIVVPLFLALEAVGVVVVFLAGASGFGVFGNILVGDEQTNWGGGEFG